ncbi:hypothetical protein NQX30_05315 [Candidatus Persebacteraceae bacterium Df01]|jgi:hypothetical protein|uniref:Uncharacterized protein n=1 Tax=Candidatus Doriopsillibacter californiensis TaxID=2970740 RepID=A0ABT7QM58_9GAMM|nr:hypothetical protein [Candidatus Persebacteraceae bacterium Df01]
MGDVLVIGKNSADGGDDLLYSQNEDKNRNWRVDSANDNVIPRLNRFLCSSAQVATDARPQK